MNRYHANDKDYSKPVSYTHLTSTGILDDSPLRGTIWEGYIPYSIRSHERGKLLDEYYCNPDGKIVKSKHIFYSNLKKDASNFVRTIDPYYNKRFMLYNIAKSTQYGERAVCYYLYTYYLSLIHI